MSIQETYLTPFVNGVQTIAERFIQISQFDKTITAEIVEIDPNDKYHYLVSTTGCSRLSVRSFENDSNRYKIKDTVYITIPNGDFSSPNKYIIGKTNKVEYKSSIKSIDDLLVAPYQQKNINDNPIYINNANRYSMIIIEFVPRITTHISNEDQTNILLEETAFSFTIKGKRKEETYSVTNIWTTKSLYGNIFNNLIPNKQRIILAEMRDLEEVKITWESVSKDNIPILTYGGKETQNSAKLELSDFIYYYGYTPEEFDRNEVDGVTIVETYNGPQMHCRNSYYFQNLGILENEKGKDAQISYQDYAQYWPNQEKAYDYIVDLQNQYSGEELIEAESKWNSFVVELKSLPLEGNDQWNLQIYKRDYLASKQDNENIPPFWRLINDYDNFANNEIIDQINDTQYIDSAQNNTLVALVHSVLDYEKCVKLTNEYNAEYTAISENLSLSLEEYTEKIKELQESFTLKKLQYIDRRTIYDILE